MLSRTEILARKVGKGTAELPSGGEVAIRALTRDEALKVNELDTTADRENMIIHLGMTDPKLSLEDVAAWAVEGSAGDLAAISNAVGRLSGMVEGAGKSSV
jgi:hypothetical protein